MPKKLLSLFTALALVAGFAAYSQARFASDIPVTSKALEKRQTQQWAQPIDLEKRLFSMKEGLYRSALPDAQMLPFLQDNNVKTVINFYQKPDSLWLTDSSIKQVHLPLRTDRITDAQVLEVLRAMDEAEQQGGVLIHCKHGQNRTGLIAAMYRILYQGWSREEAISELKNGGFGGVDRMQDALEYLTEVDLVAMRSALDSGDCSPSMWSTCHIAQLFD